MPADGDWENCVRSQVLSWKGTEESFSYEQCFLYLVSSSINVSIFHIMWLDTFWTDLIVCHTQLFVFTSQIDHRRLILSENF